MKHLIKVDFNERGQQKWINWTAEIEKETNIAIFLYEKIKATKEIDVVYHFNSIIHLPWTKFSICAATVKKIP